MFIKDLDSGFGLVPPFAFSFLFYVFDSMLYLLLKKLFDREVRCGHRNSLVVLVLVVVLGISLSSFKL